MKFVSISQFAKTVNLSANIIKNLIWQGKIPCLKFGKRTFIDIDSANNALTAILAESKADRNEESRITVIHRTDRVKKSKGRLPDKLRKL